MLFKRVMSHFIADQARYKKTKNNQGDKNPTKFLSRHNEHPASTAYFNLLLHQWKTEAHPLF
ncbi:Uncharacterised protein [Vibrio cholerae]|uniref:Uncharacterized protein n=1 Tax=Vibrio cholerae TaxID=666 RepID=A0A655P3M9_VIBCL|nr:Uncharacterised protein [Vibrio cholerae]CSI75122.1 Uncharacterised protein [Vibrio cholerae]